MIFRFTQSLPPRASPTLFNFTLHVHFICSLDHSVVKQGGDKQRITNHQHSTMHCTARKQNSREVAVLA